MLTDLSLACKYEHCKPEHNVKYPIGLNFESLKAPKINWAKKVDEENGIICVDIMLISKVMVIEMSKNDLFFLISHSMGKLFKCNWKILLFLRYLG